MFLGINAFFHDSSACLVNPQGCVIAAVEEERFTRRKREGRFPGASIQSCLDMAGCTVEDISAVAFSWHPASFLLERVLFSNLLQYPVEPSILVKNLRRVGQIASVKAVLQREIGRLRPHVRVRYFRHHLSHAASAYYPSPFEEAAYLTMDGCGELTSITWGQCRGAEIRELGRCYFPDSIGKLYSAVCRFLGFHGPQKDGTVMALAAYGEPRYLREFQQVFRLRPGKAVPGVKLSRRYFDLQDVAHPTPALEKLLGVGVRQPGEPITQGHKDVAATLQRVTQDAIMDLLCGLHRLTQQQNLVMAGGVALNSVSNGMILARTPFHYMFIQPAAHDAGLALGGALLLAHAGRSTKAACQMHSAALGPSYSNEQIRRTLDSLDELGSGFAVEHSADIAALSARLLADGKAVGWFQGRLEFGPRALGNRSILADPRDPNVQGRLNCIKGREPFRPFAAAILQERAEEWLCRHTESPFMLLVDMAREPLRHRVPGVQHCDATVRVQTVRPEVDPLFHRLIRLFFELTGVPMVLNTSLNIRGEPLVCTPEDALLRVLGGSP